MKSNEPRRLIKFGNSSYIVSLPKEWIEKNNLKKGELIYMDYSKNKLVLSPMAQNYTEEEKKMTIDTKSMSLRSLRREILSAYSNNFNYFEINGNFSREALDEIKSIISGLIGMEIVDSSKTKVIAKDYLDIRAIELEKVIRRIDNTIRSMFEELRNGLESDKFKKNNFEDIYKADDTLNSLFFLVCKLSRKGLRDSEVTNLLKTTPEELSSYHWIAMNFENIGDELKRLARYLKESNLKGKEKERLKSLCTDIESMYLMLMGAVYSKDKALAKDIMESKKDMIEKCRSFCKNKNDSALIRITERLEAISILMHNISRLILY